MIGAPFRRSASPYFLEAKDQWLRSAKPGRGLRRGNESARTVRHRDSGGGGPLELAKRANRGGGGAGRGASLQTVSLQKRRVNMFGHDEDSCGALMPPPPPPPCCAGWSPSPAVAVADEDWRATCIGDRHVGQNSKSNERQRFFDFDFSPISFSLVLLHPRV